VHVQVERRTEPLHHRHGAAATAGDASRAGVIEQHADDGTENGSLDRANAWTPPAGRHDPESPRVSLGLIRGYGTRDQRNARVARARFSAKMQRQAGF